MSYLICWREMVRKKNLNPDFHIKMGCMRAGQRLILFRLEKEVPTGRSICISTIVESGRKEHRIKNSITQVLHLWTESYILYFPLSNLFLTLFRISLCADLSVLISFLLAFLFVSSPPVEKIHQNSCGAYMVKLGKQLPSLVRFRIVKISKELLDFTATVALLKIDKFLFSIPWGYNL